MKLGFAIVLTLLALAAAGLGADRDLDTTIFGCRV